MRLIIYRRELIQIQMGVALGGREARMPEHLLYNSQIRAAVEKVRGKGMA